MHYTESVRGKKSPSMYVCVAKVSCTGVGCGVCTAYTICLCYSGHLHYDYRHSPHTADAVFHCLLYSWCGGKYYQQQNWSIFYSEKIVSFSSEGIFAVQIFCTVFAQHFVHQWQRTWSGSFDDLFVLIDFFFIHRHGNGRGKTTKTL